MKLHVVTGLCGSGKSFYCSDKNSISYDSIYSYFSHSLNYAKIDMHLSNCNDLNELYLDAYNNELLKYIITKFNLSNNDIDFILIYTDIDDYYHTIAIQEPRDFNQTLYDSYVESITNTINIIKNNVQTYNCNILYKYRKGNVYIDYTNDDHLNSILNESKESRLLNFIDKTSGANHYQSIILDNKYIRKGTEKDWITFDNILKCTSLKDKIICDTGCFNGYFSFKCISEGAKKVIGIDHNRPALNICNKIAIYNNLHLWKDGKKIDVSCELGIHFYEHKIGKDIIFEDEKTTPKIDIIFALNYLHHLKNELGELAFLNTIDSFFKNSTEVIFEINEGEISDIHNLADINSFTLCKQIESHRKTSFGNRFVLYYKK
uniref:Methyltransferase domain-containing protein n=1 Tax=viral metagenome TaxID=1070528 RepID=A0A6C0E2U8_9ZZZZ